MRTTRALVAGTILFAAAGLLLAQGKAEGPTIRPVDLEVHEKPPAGLEEIFARDSAETSLRLLISDSGRQFLKLDEQASRIDRFSDGKETDLLGGERFAGKPGWLGIAGPRISRDGHHCLVPIRSEKTPAVGASELQLKGTLVVLCGSGEETGEQEELPLREGSKMTAGPVPMTVSEVRDAPFGGQLAVQMTYHESDHAIKEIRWFNEFGQPIKAEVQTHGSMGFGGKRTYTKTWVLNKRVGTVGLKITYFSEVEAVEVPVDLSIGVGL